MSGSPDRLGDSGWVWGSGECMVGRRVRSLGGWVMQGLRSQYGCSRELLPGGPRGPAAGLQD